MVKPPPPPPPRNENGDSRFQKADPKWSRLLLWLAMFALLALVFLPSISPSNTGDEIAFDDLLGLVADGGVTELEINNLNGEIEGVLAPEAGAEVGEPFTSKGPLELSDSDRAVFASDPDLELTFDTPQSSIWASLLPLLLPITLLIAVSYTHLTLPTILLV